MSHCKAKNPGTCRVHGTSYIAGMLYNNYVVKRGFAATPEDFNDFVNEVSIIADSYETDPNTELSSRRDAATVFSLYQQTYAYAKDSSYQRAHFPLLESIQTVLFLQDKDATKLPDKNLLDTPDKKASNEEKYKHVLASYLAKKGSPVAADASYYGWHDWDMTQHLNKCEIVAIEDVKEDTWHEFNGTFNEDDDSVHGITGHGQCRCGYFKGEVRVEDSVTNIIRDVVGSIL